MNANHISRLVIRLFGGLIAAFVSGTTIAQICTPPTSGTATFFGNSYFAGSGQALANQPTLSFNNTVAGARTTPGGTPPTGGWAISQTAIAANDLVFIIQMQDATLANNNDDAYGDGVAGGFGQGTDDPRNSGRWEFGLVNSATATSITLKNNLQYEYNTSSASATATRRSFQVIRVQQNKNLVLSSASNLSVVPWDGSTGGVIVFDDKGTLDFNGVTINANGAGFRGGGSLQGSTTQGSVAYITSTSNASNLGGMKGEGIAGTPRLVRGTTVTNGYTGTSSNLPSGDQGYPGTNDRSRGAPGNAGGGGTSHNSGGGGGSNSGTGGKGGYSFAFYETALNAGNCGATAARTFPNAATGDVGDQDPTAPNPNPYYACGGDSARDVGGNPGATVAPSADRLILGGGAGAGDNNNAGDDNASKPQASGGNGGGLILVRASAVTGSGTLTANGQDGENAGRDGAGGGGAGGTVALAIPNPSTATTLSLTISAVGGKGGNTGRGLYSGAGEAQGPGGAGGGGSILKPTNVSLTGSAIGGGAAGLNIPVDGVSNPYGTAAGAGQIATIDYQPTNLPNSNACYQPNVTKTTSTPLVVQGQQTTASYTVTISQPANRLQVSGVNLVDDLPSPFNVAAGTNATMTYAGGASGPATLAATGTGAGPYDPVTFGVSSGTAANSFTIPPGGSVTVTFTVNVNGAAAGTYQNPVSVNTTNAATNLPVVSSYDPASSTAEDVVIPARPTFSKAFDPVYLTPSAVSKLTVTLNNTNGSAATISSALVDSLPLGVLIAAAPNAVTTCGGTGSVTTTQGNATTPATVTLPNTRTIPASGSCTFSVDVTASTLGVYNNSIPASALVTSFGSPTSPATAPLVVIEPAKSVKLLTDADGSGAPSAGDTLQYTLVYSAPAGAPTITSFQIFDILPSQLTATSSAVTVAVTGVGTTAAANASYTGIAGATTSSLLQSGATLAAGGTITVTVKATINAGVNGGTTIDNTARATGLGLPSVTGNGTSGGVPSDADATPSGSLPQPQDTPGATEPTRVTTVALSADVVTTKTGPARVNTLGQVTYIIQIRDAGPDTASNVVVTDSLPTGSTFVSAGDCGTDSACAAPTNLNITPTAGALTFPSIASLANGVSRYYRVIVTAPASGPITNLVSSTSSTPDPTPANNDATPGNDPVGQPSQVTTTVNQPPVTNDVTNVKLNTTAGATTLNPNLSGTDPDGTVTNYVIKSLPTNGTLALNGTAVTVGQVIPAGSISQLTFDPDGTAPIGTGTSFTYAARDNDGLEDATPNTYTIPLNQPPVTQDRTNATLNITAGPTVLNPNLLGTDPDGTVTNYVIKSLPTNGTLALNGTPVTVGQVIPAASIAQLTFDPDGTVPAGGSTSFTYAARDNDGLEDATPNTYTIPLNQPPVTQDRTNADIPLNAAATVLNPNLLGTDPDGTVTNYVIKSLPTNGTLALNGTPVTVGQVIPAASIAQLTFDPDGTVPAGGSTSFTYAARDNLNLEDATPNTYTIPILSADVATTKTGPTTVNAGAQVTYIVRTQNNGTGAASNVVVTDTLPTGSSFVSAADCAADSTCAAPTNLAITPAAGVLTFPSIASLTNGSSRYYRVIVTAPATGTLTNLVSSTSSTPDPTPANNDAAPGNDPVGQPSQVTTTVLTPGVNAVKTVAKIGGPLPITAGDTLEYTITITNSGAAPANGSSFTDALPAGTSYVANTATVNGTAVTGAATYPFGSAVAVNSLGAAAGVISNVAPNNTVTIRFRVTVNAPPATTISNQGTVNYTGGPAGGVPTDDPTTPAANDPTVVSVPRADLVVTKTGPAGVNAGAQVTYIVQARNAGPDTATSVVARDTLPTGATFVSAADCTDNTASCTTPNPIGITPAAGVLTFPTIASLTNGSSRYYRVIVTASATGTLTNLVSGSAAEYDPTPVNNDATPGNDPVGQPSQVTTTVNQPPVTNDVTNATLNPTAGPTVLNPNLSGTDPDGTVTNYVIKSLPTNGTLALNGTPVTVGQVIPAASISQLTFDPDGTVPASSSTNFTYAARDNLNLEDATPNTYTIPLNQPPVTQDRTNTKLNTTAGATTLNPNLLGTDPDGTVTNYVIKSLPTNGTLALNGTPVTVGQVIPAASIAQLTFDPDGTAPTGTGTSFTYAARDNLNLEDATPNTYTIPLNQPPVTNDATNAVLNAGAGPTVLNPNLSGSDPDGTVSNYVVKSLPTNGTLALNGTPVTVGQVIPAASIAQLTFDPDGTVPAGGSTSFTYAARDNDGLEDATPNTYTIPVILPAATVTGVVYSDLNNNGTQDPGEPGLAGVPVTITPTTGSPVVVTTDSNGNYSAPNIPAGQAIANVTDPTGTTLTTANDPQPVTVPSTGTVATTPVGFFQPVGTVVGRVFRDDNGNGSQGSSEPGLAGVQVRITNGSFTAVVTTDANGDYKLDGVPVGSATVDIVDSTLPVGVTQTAGVDPSTVTVLKDTTNDAGADGYRLPPPVATNNSATTPLDTPVKLPGATDDTATGPLSIDLTSVDLDPNAPGDQKTRDVPEGRYTANPDGTITFTPKSGTTGSVTPIQYTVRDTAGTTSNPATLSVDIGAPTKGNVTGVVFRDDNGNGTQDGTEPGLSGVSVAVTNGTFSQTVVTDGNGKYTAVGVPEGTATVDVVDSTLPANYTRTTGASDPSTVVVVKGTTADAGKDGYRPNPPVATGNSATTPLNTPVTFPVTADDSATGPNTIDPKTIDLNPSTPGEDKTLVVPEGKFTANPDGTVTFAPNPGFTGSVSPIPYTVKDNTGQLSNPAPISVSVGAPTKGDVTGVVFRDTNGNGTQDPGEPGLSGVQVKVTNGTFTQTVTTDSSGKYTAIGVPVGTAVVDVVDATLPAGVTQTAGVDPSSVTVVAGSTADAGKDGYRAPPPVATNDTKTTTLNTPVTLEGATNDTATGPNTVDVSSVDLDPSTPGDQKTKVVPEGVYSVNPNGTVTFTPNAGVTGSVTPIQYTVRDTAGTTSNPATLSVDIGAPTKGEVSGIVFRDDNGNGVQDGAEPGLPGVQVLVTNGSFSQTVTTDPNGKYTAAGVPLGQTLVNVVDSSLPAGFAPTVPANDPSTITVVAGKNDAGVDGYRPNPPVAVGDSANTPLNTPVTFSITGNDSATAPNKLDPKTVDLDPSTPGEDKTRVVPEGTFTANPDGTVTFAPNPGFTGPVTPIQYTVKDTAGNLSNPAPINVVVGPSGTVTGLIFRDDNGNGTQDVGEPGLPGVQVQVTNGGFVQTATTDPSGRYSVPNVPLGVTTVDVVEATLPTGVTQTAGTDPTTLTVVAGNNNAGIDGYRLAPPKAVNDSATTPLDTPVIFSITGNDSASNPYNIVPNTVDLDPATPGDQKSKVVPEGKFEVNGVGEVIFTPNPGFSGNVTPITYTVLDSSGQKSNPATIAVKVLPNASDDTATTRQNRPVTIPVLGNDKGNLVPSTVKVATPPVNGTTKVNPDGSIEYTPKPGFIGTDTFTYTVCDTAGSCRDATVTVNVTPLNTGTLTGNVYTDANGNAVHESAETGIPGATVTLLETEPVPGQPGQFRPKLDANGKPIPLKDVDGNPIPPVKTDANGNYTFNNVPNVNVAVQVTDPKNLVLTTNNNPQIVNVQPSITNKAADVGYTPARIDLTITPDKTVVTPGDNLPYTVVVTNKSPGLTTPLQNPVLTITLPTGVIYDPKKPVTVDGVVVPPGNISTRTDGVNQVLVIKLPNELKNDTPQTIKFDTVVTPAVDPKKPLIAVAEVVATAINGTTQVQVSSTSVAAAAVRVDLGVFTNQTILLGRVYFDNNDNNNFDAGDTPLAGARIYLSDGRTAVTDQNGRYSIPGLQPGVYAVRLDPVTAPYTVKRVPDDQGAPGTRYVRAPDSGGIDQEDFLLVAPTGAVVKARSTLVQRGPVTITKAITQGGAGYAVTFTVTVTKAVRNLSITDPLPQSAERGPVTGAKLEGNVLRFPGVTQPGTYTVTYALFTALPPDLALTDPDINYEEIFTLIPRGVGDTQSPSPGNPRSETSTEVIR